MNKQTRNLGVVIVIGLILGLGACNIQKRLTRKRHIYMQKAYTDLKDSLTNAQVTILNDTIKMLFPENLLFHTGASKLLPGTKPLLYRFARALIKYNKTSILINGYTDNTGSQARNRQLSEERAVNTGNALKTDKVKANRIYTWGHGSNNPIASNKTAAGRRLNRRVEFIILYNSVK